MGLLCLVPTDTTPARLRALRDTGGSNLLCQAVEVSIQEHITEIHRIHR
jgi:hypothetical protein